MTEEEYIEINFNEFHQFKKRDVKEAFKDGKSEGRKEIVELLKAIHFDYEVLGHEQHAAAIEYVIWKLENL